MVLSSYDAYDAQTKAIYAVTKAVLVLSLGKPTPMWELLRINIREGDLW